MLLRRSLLLLLLWLLMQHWHGQQVLLLLLMQGRRRSCRNRYRRVSGHTHHRGRHKVARRHAATVIASVTTATASS
jgi:hypothetical protein